MAITSKACRLCVVALLGISRQQVWANADPNVTNATSTSAPSSGDVDVKTMVHVMGQSGKFTVYKADEGKDNGITVTIDELHELDGNFTPVGKSGNVKHTINSFATQDFTVEDMVDVQINDTVAASLIAFHSPIANVGQIKVDTYIIKESGVVGPPDGQWEVAPGDLKWAIELSAWNWCGCSQGGGPNAVTETGEYIDVVLTVQAKGNATKKEGDDKSVDLGDGVSLDISNKVQIDDGDWVDMPEGFPSMELQGSKVKFTFRFPKFTNKALYDPVFTGLQAATSTQNQGQLSFATSSAPSAILCMIAMFLATRVL